MCTSEKGRERGREGVGERNIERKSKKAQEQTNLGHNLLSALFKLEDVKKYDLACNCL